MVAELVDQHMGDDVAQRFLVLGPIVENGAPVERDAVRAFAGGRVPAFRDAAALEQAEQVERGFQRQIVHDLLGRKLGDLNDDLAGQRAKVRRQMRIGFQRQDFHLVDRRGELIVPGAGLVDAGHVFVLWPPYSLLFPALRGAP